MTKWVKWDGDPGSAIIDAFGEGPFPVLKEKSDTYLVLAPIEIEKNDLVLTIKDKNLLREIRQALGAIGVISQSQGKKEQQEVNPLANYMTTYDKVISPYTDNFKPGQRVNTPEGYGNVTEVRFKDIKVKVSNKEIIFDYKFVKSATEVQER